MQKILIIGATSAIAQATARRFAAKGANLGRNLKRLEELASDLRTRHASSVSYASLDVMDFNEHEAVIDRASQAMGGIDVALLAHGTLGDRKACEKSFSLAHQELNTNAISGISLLTHLANRFEMQNHGTIAVISSVAGDRGRQSNYVYGTAKGAVTIFLQGLRNRLFKSKVNVLTIKPGFVDTPMTSEFKKGLLWASSETIADGIERAILNRKEVVYLPFWWGLIMLIIKHIPESLFKRLQL